MENLSTKEYKNEFVNSFVGDERGKLYPRQTPGVLYSKIIPTPVKKPEILGWSDNLAKELEVQKPINQDDINILSGNLVTPSMKPYSACYGGHQFGNWAGQLGDGRAITLGEWETSLAKSWELQLKGSGPTPYSRSADGRAVLRSSVREYLMSEAMFHLGVPTTRALSLVATGEDVLRDMFYNGNARYEPGAIVLRTAPSFLRFGNFEILAARDEMENLKKLVDWTIEKFYSHIQAKNDEDKIILWFKEVVNKTANLIVDWLRVGFVHGVMNTDNMSILGLTIDYGPFSFLDDYDPNFTPNTTDLPGRRYAFGKQASIAYWNLGCLARAIVPLLKNKQELVKELENYREIFLEKYYSMMASKLGFDSISHDDMDFIVDFEKMLATVNPDMTIFYQLLIDLSLDLKNKEDVINHFKDSFYQELQADESENLYNLIKAYSERIKKNTGSREESLKIMRKSNPRFILRNYLLHQASEELEKGENKLFLKLQEAIKEPYSKKFDEFFTKRPDWAGKKAGCSMLSCSS